MELFITRHGETYANVNKILDGHQGGELTELGFLQAQLLGKRLSRYKFDHIYISDLNRTKQTAEFVIKHHNDTSITYDSRIREKSGGILEGKPIKYVKDLAKKKNISLRLFKPINGENWLEIYHKARLFLNDLLKKYININYTEEISFSEDNKISLEHRKEDVLKLSQNNVENKIQETKNSFDNFKKILLITHGGFIMELMNVIRNKKGLESSNKNTCLNTAIYLIRIYCSYCGDLCRNNQTCNKLDYDIILYNDISHLDR